MNRNILTCELFIFIILVINPSFKYMHGLVLRDLIDTFFLCFVKLSISMILFPYALVEFTPREICNPLFSTFILGLRSWCKDSVRNYCLCFSILLPLCFSFKCILIWKKMEMGLYFWFDCV